MSAIASRGFEERNSEMNCVRARLPIRKARAIPILVIGLLAFALCACGKRAETRERERGSMLPGESKAEEQFRLGRELRGKEQAEAYSRSRISFLEAARLWAAANSPPKRAEALWQAGLVSQLLNDHPSAICFFNEALQLSRTQENRILNDLCNSHIQLGETGQAIQTCNQAHALNQQSGDQQGLAKAVNNLGELEYGQGNLKQSLEYYEQALGLWREAEDQQERAHTLLNIGLAYSDLGESKAAFEHYRKSLSLATSIGSLRDQAVVLTAMGRLHSRLGENQAALGLFKQAMELIEITGDQEWRAGTLNGIAYVYETFGEQQTALSYYTQALDIFKVISNKAGEAQTHGEIGRTYFALGQSEKALDHFQVFHKMSLEMNDRWRSAFALRQIGMIYHSRGERETAIRYYARALRDSSEINDRRSMARAYNLIGNVHLEGGSAAKARGDYGKALPLCQVTEDHASESQTLYNLARAESRIGNLQKAHDHVLKALGIIDTLRTQVVSQELRSALLASVYPYYELNIDLLMRMKGPGSANNFRLEALRISEQARARSLLEMLAESRANIRQKSAPQLIDRARQVQTRINLLAERKSELLNNRGAKVETEQISREINLLLVERDQIESEIKLTNPHYAALSQPKAASIEELRKLATEDTIVLEYALGSERSYLWAVLPDRILSFQLHRSSEIEPTARRILALLSEWPAYPQSKAEEHEKEYWKQAAQLSRIVLSPVAHLIGRKRLLIVPDGVLQYIPFQALPAPGPNTQSGMAAPSPLMADHEIVNLPSASILIAMRQETPRRRPASNSIALIADPVYEKDDIRFSPSYQQSTPQIARTAVSEAVPGGPRRDGGALRRLYYTRYEAEAIQSITSPDNRLELIGFAANRDAILTMDLSPYRIIHFATHGNVDSEQPELSSIILSLYSQQAQRVEGHLRLHDIYNLNLPADLVVLSACETGIGKAIKGEGLIGLTRGFMYAGASRVMASLWKVSDRSTAELMKRFYQYHLKEGLPPAAALQKAQLTMWQQPEWRSPYHWAGFVLQGEYK